MNNLLKHFVGIPPVYLYAPTRPLFTQIANTDIFTPRPEIRDALSTHFYAPTHPLYELREFCAKRKPISIYNSPVRSIVTLK